MNQKNKQIIYFIQVFSLVLCVILFGSATILFNQFEDEKNSKIERQKELVTDDQRDVTQTITEIGSDLFLLRSQIEVQNIADLNTKSASEIRNNNPDLYTSAISEFQSFVQHKDAYRQARYISEFGKEIIRIDRVGEKIKTIPIQELQDKSNRYYFRETSKLDDGDIYISKLDLNIENGAVETPFLPMLRVATPVVDSSGARKGIIILNYSAENILSLVSTKISNEYNLPFMLNADGFWLIGFNKDAEWSFMFPRKEQYTFSGIEPEVWDSFSKQVDSNSEGFYQTKTRRGLYTLSTIFPKDSFPKNIQIVSDDEFWAVGSFVSAANLTSGTTALIRNIIITDIVLISIIGVLIFLWTQSKFKVEKNRRKIHSINEVLTITNKILRHDLANKFTGIKMLLETEKDAPITAETARYIYDSSTEGIEIIRGMKDLEKLTRNEENKTILIRTVLEKLVKRSSIPITLTGENLSVKADDALYSVFKNIIDNAITHGETKKMDIEIKKKNTYAIVTFKDYGKGVPNNIKEKLFTEGFTHGETGNTGLGLYIVERTIKRYKGRVSIADNVPKGTIITISIPML